MRTVFQYVLALTWLLAGSFCLYELLEGTWRVAGIAFAVSTAAYWTMRLLYNAETYGERQRAQRLKDQLLEDVKRELGAQ